MNDRPLCSLRCGRVSTLDVDEVPFCEDCADAWLERQEALASTPSLRDRLPALTLTLEDHAGFVAMRGYRDPRRVRVDDERLRALRQQWIDAGCPGDVPRAELAADPAPGSVTRDEPLAAPSNSEPAGQLSLLADEL